jgi:hypothetical protein
VDGQAVNLYLLVEIFCFDESVSNYFKDAKLILA